MNNNEPWSRKSLIIFCLFLLIGILLRFYHLELRPLHHDESLHGIYSLYFLEDAAKGFYKYDPLLHGPLLYHITPWSLFLFGLNNFAIRLPAVMLGSSLMFLPLVFSRLISKATLLCLTLFLALSPSLTYWSRFLRHDGFLLFGLLISLFAIFKVRGFGKAILLGLGFAIQFCAKENSFIHLLFIFVFLIFEESLYRLLQVTRESSLKKTLSYILEHPIACILGLATFGAIFAHYYSAGFVYQDGIWDGLYRKSIGYWFEQHQRERITGPFSYNFFINSFFETWFLPALLLHLFGFYRRQTWLVQLGFIFSFLFSVIAHFYFKNPLTASFFTHWLKLKISFDFYLFFPLLYHSIVATSLYLFEGRKEKACAAFFFFASLFTYCYLGEKVPWLAIYPLLTGLIFYAFDFDRVFHWPIIPVLVTIFIHLGYTNYWTNFSHSYAPENLLSQVHTSLDFETTLKEIRGEIESYDQGKGPKILAYKGITWPTTWYLHGREEYQHQIGRSEFTDYKYILSWTNDSSVNLFMNNSENLYRKEIIPLRHWWLPNYNELNIGKAWRYFFRKETWGPNGETEIALWVRNNSSLP